MKLRVLLPALCLVLFAGQSAFSQYPIQCIDYATVSILGGGSEIITCEGDGVEETYKFKTSTLAMPFGYLVTDENNIILKVSISSRFGFEGLGEGNLRVWAFSFLGTVTAQPGQDATTTRLATLCSALTTNFIPITNFVPDGGAVATTDGNTSEIVCVGDGNPDIVEFTTTATAEESYSFLVTDENNIILSVPAGNSADFDGASAGTCRVWGIAHGGNLTAAPGDTVGVSSLAGDCFGLSENFIEIIRTQPDGGSVALTNGETTATVCVGDGQPDVLSFTNETSSPAPYAFVVTDDNNTILAILDGNSNDFEGAGAGVCRVWGLSYTGNVTAAPGDDAAAVPLSDDCFELSENFVEVIRQEANGGSVALADGATEAFACVGDGVADTFTFTNDSDEADNYTYLITDESNIILAFAPDATFDFDGAGIGTCRVWGLAYGGALLAEVGDNAAEAILADGCFGLSDNFITIRRETVEGGTVAMPNGETIRYTCPGDGVADIVMFDSSGTSSGAYTYVITDDNNVILGLPAGDSNDFDGAPAGTCRVWGLAYTGNITAQLGDNAAEVALSDECFDLSDNFITVVRETPEGGTVAMPNGETTRYTCPGDGVADIVMFDSTGTSSGPYTYVITDDNNVILGLPAGDSNDFDGAPAGTCRVWGLAYTGNITAQLGDNAAAVALSDDCFDLSDNFITVVRETPEGGTVAMPNGETTRYTCPGDGVADIVMFDSTGTSSGPYTYVITDDNNVILGLPTGDSNDFDGAPAGTCRVWGLAYTGNITAQVGDNAAEVALSDDCFDLSDNFITVVRETPEGGTVAMPNGETTRYTCPGDGMADIVMFDSSGTSSGAYTYVITDDNNVILGLPTGDSNDFDGAPAGTCRVWGLAYTGTITAQLGDDAAAVALSDDCFDLSDNFITVVRETPEGGTVAMPNGETTRYTCPGDGMADIVMFDSSGTSSGAYTYVITDDNNVILGLPTGDSNDFDGAPAGTCRVWGLAYTGNITAQLGDNAAEVALSDDCFDLSDNFITVVRETPEGGTVAMPNGETMVNVCSGDGVADIVMFDSTGTSSGPYTYVITDDNNVILGLPTGDSNDFDSAPAGTCRVWGLAYTGTITAQVGDNAAEVALSDDCFDLSDNFITVVRETPEGGTVAMPNGETTRYTCPGDGVADIVMFDSTGTSSGTYAYVITDTNNIILGLPEGDMADFDGASSGICRVWGLAYTGTITAQVGDDAAAVALSDDCFDLSDNFITVVRETPEGGTVAMPNGETTRYTCPGDGMADIVMFDSTGTSSGPYTYVITDDNNVILGLPTGDSNDFDGAPAGTCRVWGLAYTGTITAQVGDNAAEVALSDDCFDLSDNFITVVRETPEGGSIATEDGETEVLVCPSDGVADLVFFDSTGTSSGPFAYVITDDAEVILGFVEDQDFANFDVAGVGNCHVWGLAYTGTITATVGDTATAVALSDDCFDLSDNFINVVRQIPEGGTVATESGETEVAICPGDGLADIIRFDSAGTIALYTYVVTDDNNNILALPEGDFQDFDQAGIGLCRVWGLAYTGNITAQVGDNAAEVSLSDDCFDLSDNFITVVREVPEGGTVAMPNGETTRYTCPGDGMADIVMFDSSGTSGLYTYVITDDNNVILALPEGDSNDFDGAPAGTCRVWGLAYSGNITAQVGDNAAEVALSDDCFDLSDNFITVIRQAPEGGTVAMPNGETIRFVCPGDGMPDIVMADSAGTVGLYTYVITDEENIILSLALPGGDTFDFDGAPEGTCRIWGLAFTGSITAQVGDNAAEVALSDDCFDLSDNFITVIRQSPDAGTIATEEGPVSIDICVGDGMADSVSYFLEGASDNNTLFLITDENDFLISAITESSFDFDNAVPGIYRIYGLSYTGAPVTIPGDNIFDVELSSDCYDLTDNFIEITATGVDGGTIFTNIGVGVDDISLCVGDGDPNLLEFFTTTSATSASYAFPITNEEDIVLGFLPPSQIFDFEVAGPGVSKIYGISYTGTLLLDIGQNINDAQLSDGCFTLAENVITVRRDLPEAGQVATAEGENDIQVCIGPEDGLVAFTSSSTSANAYALVLADSDDNILEVIDGATIDFNPLPVGSYSVYGLSYSGTLNDVVGEAAGAATYSTSCFELTGNAVSVRRGPETDGGEIATASGEDTIYQCASDGVSDVVVLSNTSSVGLPYRYLITNSDNEVIVDDVEGNVIDFEGAGSTDFRIWGVSLAGPITLSFLDDILEVPVSDSCFMLSSNFITIIRDVPEGGTVSTIDGATEATVVVGDGVPDEITFSSAGTSNSKFTFVVTDDNNNILAVPDGDVVDFEGAAPGVCRVWGLAYTGEVIAEVGDNAAEVALSDDCWALSDNFVTVTRTDDPGIAPEEGPVVVSPAVIRALTVAPNPAIEQIVVSFELGEEAEPVSTLQILDGTGRMVNTERVPSAAGENRYEVEVANYSGGLYIIYLNNGPEIQAKKFLVARP